LAKPNYRHAKKQKEAARKARQDAKLQRRTNSVDAPAQSEAKADGPVAAAVGVQPANS
jgi:hypothetical protein